MEHSGIPLRASVGVGRGATAVHAEAPALRFRLPAGLHAPRLGAVGGAAGVAARAASRADRVDVAMAAAFAALVVGMGTVLAVPQFEGRTAAAAIDVGLHTVSLLVTSIVAMHAARKFRQSAERIALFQGAAFGLMALADAGGLVLTLASLDVPLGMAPTTPQEELVCGFGLARLFAAALLIAGAFSVTAKNRFAVRRDAALATVAWLVAVACVAMLLVELAPDTLSGPVELVEQMAGAALFAGAALAYRQVWRRLRSPGDAFIALAMVPTAFVMLFGVFHPSVFRGTFSTADLVRLCVDALLLLGLEAESQTNIRAIRTANESIVRLKEAEVQRAAMEERAWLARELHDGLAQELWLIKLKTAWLSSLLEGRSDTDDELRLVTEVSESVDAGLADARGAVAALRGEPSPGDSLDRLLAHELDEFQDRFGLLVDYDAAVSLPPLSPRAAGELTRIVREALTNVRKHAEATVVRVTADVGDEELVLGIHDNGRGFNPASARGGHFGLTGMRERAEQLGGSLTIRSGRHEGTEVSIRLPLPAEPCQ